ncbi:lysozyme inhibitor LprI family protein [Arenimonas oryziterrae]|uniref:Lysozyme inhibitor LprI-like N-terminal domain-containing protein n=1 Tax=Arenimonas oryziterrae DSM 21050 = YC6267 TaxID=1121015 RepID=A0A091AZ73_9GAMM|nr:lysozyme inhibitor LprI family protein [Arenimonas oryziterrae]KFN44602.1 hypothetical protein N789_00925 [Arenimonas oryziterrae DSM 21050 = YC6267]
MRPLILIPALLLPALMLIATASRAASFDCRKASVPSEKAICADRELSGLDDQLAASYKQALGAWQGRIAEYVRADQKAWLAETRRAGLEDDDEIDNAVCDGPLTPCLRDRYRARLAAFASPAYRHSGIYLRSDGSKLLIYATGALAVRVYNKPAAIAYSSREETGGAAWASSDRMRVQLDDDSGKCTLDITLNGTEAVVSKNPGCALKGVEGRFKRDLKDVLANYELDIY